MKQWWKNEYYSQFGEDAVLHGFYRRKMHGKTRSLDSIQKGFFVDVGSHHPYMVSNTWFLYQRGWRGINIDPTPGVKEDFDKHRPEDVNLELAISDHDGTAKFFSYGRHVKNTLDSSRVDIGKLQKSITVPTMRLESLLDKFLPAGQQIDLLSIDVEGVDLDVIQSNNWDKYRPEMIVVELHSKSIDDVIKSEIYSDILKHNYILYAWTQPSLIFRRVD
jgi:FkbM family methyltransferase